MKVLLCLFALLACTMTLHAQEVTADTVATMEEYQPLEDSDDGDDEDYAEDETPAVTHERVAPDQLPTTQDHVRQKMNVRKFDDAAWKKVIGDEKFTEKPDKPKKKEPKDDSPFQMPNLPWDGSTLRVIAYIIVIALIVGVIYLFTKDLRFKVKVKPSGLPAEDLAQAVENIEHIEIATPLQKALAEGNFKLATRLYFLDLLKRLNETGIITWKKDKTNRDYLMEVYGKEFHYAEIHRLTVAYELVWYGEHALSHEAYQKLFSAFESTFKHINTPAAA